jgi:hypothetical protein
MRNQQQLKPDNSSSASLARVLPSPSTISSFDAGFSVAEAVCGSPANWMLACCVPAGIELSSVAGLSDKLESLLLYHMLQGSYDQSQLLQGYEFNSLLGDELKRDLPITFTSDGFGDVRASRSSKLLGPQGPVP